LIAAYLFLVPNDVLLQMYALPRETLYGMAAVATVVAVLGRRLLLNKGL
jgi:membrane protein YqaA with SNARE-associated domain